MRSALDSRLSPGLLRVDVKFVETQLSGLSKFGQSFRVGYQLLPANLYTLKLGETVVLSSPEEVPDCTGVTRQNQCLL